MYFRVIVCSSYQEEIDNYNQLPNRTTSFDISPMVTSMKSTHESVPFKYSMVRLACILYQLYGQYLGGGNMGNKPSFDPQRG